MATHIEATLIDDLDGTGAAETLTFALDGVEYKIDLSQGNAAALRESLAPYITKARRVGGRRQRGAPTTRRDNNNREIRRWAQLQGMRVNSRGRLNAEVLEAYREAHAS